MNLKHMSQVAEKAMREVGVRIRDEIENPSGFKVSFKSERDLVTEVDVWAEEQLTAAILSEFPDHKILGEESAPSELQGTQSRSIPISDICPEGVWWVLDPIDGTTNFVHRIPFVGISAGVIADGKRVIGMVYDPVRQELFKAIRGQGAFVNNRAIQTTSVEKLEQSVLATGFPYDRKQNWSRFQPVFEAFIKSCRAVRRFGAASLDQCWVACGRFDGFFEYDLHAWDVAGGSIIVEEAGGKAANFGLGAQDEFSIFSDSFLFTGPKLFQEALELAQKEDCRIREG